MHRNIKWGWVEPVKDETLVKTRTKGGYAVLPMSFFYSP